MANSVDFSVVSIDPGKVSIRKGEKTFIQVDMQNNGPEVLSVGEGLVKISFSNSLLSVPTDRGFKNLNGEVWKLLSVKRVAGIVTLSFKTIADYPVSDQVPNFQFDVKGKAYGTADIALEAFIGSASTDPNIANQKASTQLIVAKK